MAVSWGEAGYPTQNLIIRNNTFADGHGGIACGSEMSGGIKNLFADNNTFDSPTLNYALRFKTNAERGGAVENIYLRNSKVKSVGNASSMPPCCTMWAVTVPICLSSKTSPSRT